MSVLPWETVAGYVYAVGLRGEAAAIAVAITEPESSRDPSNHNYNVSTGDDSWGLWQINMLGDLGPARRKRYNIADNSALLDPVVNVNAMYLESGGGSNFRPWSTFKSGAYSSYMEEARAAVAAVEARGGNAGTATSGSSGASSTSSSSSSTASADLGRSTDTSGLIPAGIRADVTEPLSAFRTTGGFTIRGQDFDRTLVVETLIGGSLDLGVDDIAELSVELSAGLHPSDIEAVAAAIDIDAPVDWFDLRLQCVGVEWSDGDAGTTVYTARCRAAGSSSMRKKDGLKERSWARMSPSEVMTERARDNGLRFVGEGSNRRDLIVRKGPEDGTDETTETTQTESDWDLGERLAREEGYWIFESAGALYFARPSWLLARMPRFPLDSRDGGLGGVDDYDKGRRDGLLGVPNARRTRSDDLKPGLPPRTITVRVPRALGEQIRPGFVCDYTGLPYFAGAYLVSHISFPLDGGIEPASIDLVEPKDPTPEPPEEETSDDSSAATAESGGGGSSSTATPTGTSGSSALDMVTIALRQVGKDYVYGAEAAPDDPDPAAFDCSELIQWACAQVGVDFVDGSENQMAAVRAAGLPNPPHGLAVADCKNIRGAFLWHTGHCAISLGDGVHTVEAMGRKYGVVQGNIGARFLGGGLIPGLVYALGPDMGLNAQGVPNSIALP